jgi:PLP dependent protein
MINNQYQAIVQECKQNNAQLIAVSKTKPISDIIELYNQGQRHFAENKVQELVSKQAQLPQDIQWHLIGHLQSNKAKAVLPYVHCIHSVDSHKLLNTIQAEAIKINKPINVLLQLYIATEDTKYGLSIAEAIDLCEYYTANNINYSHVNIIGVMGMASFTSDANIITQEFAALKKHFDYLKDIYFPFAHTFAQVSMGMSSDYKIGLQQGSTMVRIGSLLFGSRA